MTDAAYFKNQQAVSAAAFYEVACEPDRSVVVEACAGAGKTWMLVSRMLRAWLEGTPARQILAITFTRKAAGEMRQRLGELIEKLAAASSEERIAELCMRGLSPAQANELASEIDRVHAQWLAMNERPRITTIHGWLSGLVRGLPFHVSEELGLPAQWQLVEDIQPYWPQLWQAWLKAVDQHRDTPVYTNLFIEELVQGVGLFNLEKWLDKALRQRMEITLAQASGQLLSSVPKAADVLPAFEGLDSPLELLQQAPVQAMFASFARDMGQEAQTSKKVTPGKLADALVGAALAPDLSTRFALLKTQFLKADAEPKALKGIEHPQLSAIQDVLVSIHQAELQDKAHRQHSAMVWASHVLFEVYGQFKRTEGFIDMNDLELAANRLHADPELAGWVQERLDLRTSHLLMDEFQDTSPLQWQILYQWLSAYVGAGGGRQGGQSMRVFLVGDPKQSIYGFRRADARVFYAAKDFICAHLNGTHLACDHTRRNAKQVIAGVNQVMGYLTAQGQYEGFRVHTTASSVDGGVFALLPAVGAEVEASKSTSKDALVWRDSLMQARHEPDEDKGMLETRQAAQVVAQWLTHINPESEPPQPYQAGHVFVLARKRQELQRMAEALNELGIPNACPADTWLMETPEALDVLALLEVLVNPWSDVALARVLRSPMFDVSEEVLMAMAVQRNALPTSHDALSNWWHTLLHMPVSDLTAEDAQAITAARTLLPQWVEASATLPPHDLLQQVMDETGWKQTLAKRLSATKLRQALVCLDAVVSETLQLQGGRDATPSTCWQGLKQLRKRLPAEVSQSAVQLLTIHGAKGLEAELVMVLNSDPRANRDSGYELVVDWPVDASAPALCAFVSKLSELPPSLQAIKERAKQTQQLEECNALYVAMTRAKHALIFSQKPSAGRTQNNSDTWWQQLWGSQALSDEHVWPLEEQPLGLQHKAQPSMAVSLNDLAVLPSLLPRLSHAGLPVSVDISKLDDSQALLGQVVHRVLEWATSLSAKHWSDGTVAYWVKRALLQMGAAGTPEQHAVCMERVTKVLDNPQLRPWLDPDLSTWSANECPVLDAGQWLRLDRLVLHEGAAQAHWWVIDYKWHDQPDQVAAYVAQLKQYVALVQRQHPDALVSGAFISGQGQWVALP